MNVLKLIGISMLDHKMSDNKYKILGFEHALYIIALNKIVLILKKISLHLL